jgi:hypothetical protein
VEKISTHKHAASAQQQQQPAHDEREHEEFKRPEIVRGGISLPNDGSEGAQSTSYHRRDQAENLYDPVPIGDTEENGGADQSEDCDASRQIRSVHEEPRGKTD